ncbi:MAG: deaminated glutathione amidase, partial [Mycobacterium sp.]|nr:deaminated glutathione amidase [Mycobacterium sp.]
PHLLIADVDLDPVDKARDTIAVLRNRAEFAQSGRAQSLG